MAKIRDIQESADHGRVLVDEQLSELEARLTSIYSEVNDEMKKELNEYLDKYKAQDLQKQKDVENGKITQDQYENWREKKILRTDRMRAQIDDLTQTLVHTDEVAMAMIRGELPKVYATSYNFGVYRGETYANASGKDFTAFTIYNADAVRELAKNDPDLLPVNPRVDIPKDERWNRQHVQNAIAQGIIKGEPINKIADRLQTVTDMDRGAAIRNARTAVNGIENKGRKDATERLKEAGIAMVEVWSCTHDGRTRQSHVLLDYTTPDEEGYFGNGCQYPGDPDGPEEEVYNCRCSLLTFMEGIDHSKDDELYEKFMEENYFDEWLTAKEKQNLAEGEYQKNREKALQKQDAINKSKRSESTKPTSNIVNGKDITDTWVRNSDKYQFEIEDAIGSQGFDGYPQVVSAEEFEKAVQESNFIAQRTYSAPDQETLDAYREQLYSGKFYVDCGIGGAQYGQGMYCAANYNGQLTDGIKDEMTHYMRLNGDRNGGIPATKETKENIIDTFIKNSGLKGDEARATEIYLKHMTGVDKSYTSSERSFAGKTLGHSGMKALDTEVNIVNNSYEGCRTYIETMTLTPDAKVVSFSDLRREWLNDPYSDSIDAPRDIGSYAALKGYDAINAEGHGESGSYTVILNRTKVIIKGE